jgi:hypothetical protein
MNHRWVAGACSVWQPISEDKLQSLIAVAELSMNLSSLAFWERIRIRPIKWMLPPWGDDGGGFWVVAIVGQECIWYNDLEDGFNVSHFSKLFRIDDYGCSQCNLSECVTSYFHKFMQHVSPST